MTRHVATKPSETPVMPWTRHQEVVFDEFFRQRLPSEGFTIEEIAEGYWIPSHPEETRPLQPGSLSSEEKSV
jgi:hypothetical protein